MYRLTNKANVLIIYLSILDTPKSGQNGKKSVVGYNNLSATFEKVKFNIHQLLNLEFI